MNGRSVISGYLKDIKEKYRKTNYKESSRIKGIHKVIIIMGDLFLKLEVFFICYQMQIVSFKKKD